MAKVEYKKFLRYPRLMPADVSIWERFIDQNPTFFSEVEYDFKVGAGRDYSRYPEGSLKHGAEKHSQKRIDVVGFRGDMVWIIELKPSAGFSAVGQVLGLAALFREVVPTTRRVLATIITNEEIPDVRSFCSKMGVLFLIA